LVRWCSWQKKACRPFGKQAGKIFDGLGLGCFLLLAGVIDFNGSLPGATGDALSHPQGPDSALASIHCTRQLHLSRATMPQTGVHVKRFYFGIDLRGLFRLLYRHAVI
jgi:hypothetical protein